MNITLQVSIDPILLTMLAGTVIPLVTALVTKSSLGSEYKAIISLVLSAIAGTAIQINNTTAGTFEWREALAATATTAAFSIAAYVGIWKPVTNVNSNMAPGFGLGTKEPAPPQI